MEGGLMVQFQQIITGWKAMPDFLSPPVNEEEVDLLIEFSNYLMDKIMEEEEDSKLEALLHLVGSYISEYEEKNVPEPIGSPIEALEYLMEEHGLTRRDLFEIGSRGVLSEIFNGKRKLNKRQIIALSKRFKCNPLTFF
jgi:HTH-type transcriptional regulator/antitoxin HigA